MTEEVKAIRAELLKLDPKNDAQWTNEGLPLVTALSIKGLSRAQITDAAPLFTRMNPTIPDDVEPPKPEVQASAETEQYSDDDALADLELDLMLAQEELVKLDNAHAEIVKRRDAISVKRDTLVTRIEKAKGPGHSANMEGIRAVLERGKRERAEKAEFASELRKSGLKAEMFQPGSALDRAMARRKGRGLNRPQMLAGAK